MRVAAAPDRRPGFEMVLTYIGTDKTTGDDRTLRDLRIEPAAAIDRKRHQHATIADEERDGRCAHAIAHQRTDSRQHGRVFVARLTHPNEIDDVACLRVVN